MVVTTTQKSYDQKVKLATIPQRPKKSSFCIEKNNMQVIQRNNFKSLVSPLTHQH